jgi:hypothetical protein
MEINLYGHILSNFYKLSQIVSEVKSVLTDAQTRIIQSKQIDSR